MKDSINDLILGRWVKYLTENGAAKPGAFRVLENPLKDRFELWTNGGKLFTLSFEKIESIKAKRGANETAQKKA